MSGMFSLFCGPRQLSEDENDSSNMIEYLETKSLTFDTLETDGTDESSCSPLHKNTETANCESLLGTLVGDNQETLQFEKKNDMVDDQMIREGVEVRESVPSADGDSNGPGCLSPDLPVPERVEGPDMPTESERKLKYGDLSLLNDAKDPGVTESTAIVGFRANGGREGARVENEGIDSIGKTDSSAGECKADPIGADSLTSEEVSVVSTDAETDSSTPDGALMPPSAGEVTLVKAENTSQSPGEGSIDSNSVEGGDDVTSLGDADKVSESAPHQLTSSVEAPNESKVNDTESIHETGSADMYEQLGENETASDSTNSPPSPIGTVTIVSPISEASHQPEEFDTPSSAECVFQEAEEHLNCNENKTDPETPPECIANLETSAESEPAGPTNNSVEEETVASELFMPMLDHHEDSKEEDDDGDSSPNDGEGGDESKSIARLKSDATDETGSDSFDESEKSVRFTDPLVTSSWDVPRVDSDDLEELFYTAMDISKFRQQRQKGVVPPSRPYDKAHCERLVEDLDRFGAESFVAGDYQKALGAFNHSLQVKTQIMTDCDNCSTAITIHCIADCYSKKGKWIQAMDAYNAALLVLETADDTEEVRTSRVALDQKVHIIRRMLGLQRQPSL